jgi:hypothetical protein
MDSTTAIAFRKLGAHLGQLDENDVAEQRRRVLGDAHRRNVPFELKPLVLFGVFQQCLLQVRGGLAAFVLRHDEWERRDAGRQALAAHLGEDPCSGHCKRGRQITHRNRGIKTRTEATRSH